MQKLSLTQKTEAVLDMVRGCSTIDSLQAIDDIVELYIKPNAGSLNSIREINQSIDKIARAISDRSQFITKMPIIDADGTITHTQTVNE